jgi:hypothetical protein
MIIADLSSMIPFLFVGFVIKNPYLAVIVILMGLVGIVHHYQPESHILCLFDHLSILIFILALIFFLDFTQNEKKVLYAFSGIIILIFVFLMINQVHISDYIRLLLMSVSWIPVLVFLIPKFSVLSKCLISIALFFYMWNVCICNEKLRYIEITWGIFHLLCAATLYFAFRDIKLLKPEFVIRL